MSTTIVVVFNSGELLHVGDPPEKVLASMIAAGDSRAAKLGEVGRVYPALDASVLGGTR